MLAFKVVSALVAVEAALLKLVTLVILEAVLTKGSIIAVAISRCRLNFRNQKFTTVNSTRAAKTNAVHKPIQTSMACKKFCFSQERVANFLIYLNNLMLLCYTKIDLSVKPKLTLTYEVWGTFFSEKWGESFQNGLNHLIIFLWSTKTPFYTFGPNKTETKMQLPNPKVNQKWTESTRGSKIARIFFKTKITLSA